MKDQLVSLKLAKQRFHFSAAHFTIFSKTSRERLHGHNYYVEIEISYHYPGEFLDYNELKDRIKEVCDEFDEYTLIPSQSPHLVIEETDQSINLLFGTEKFTLPLADVKLIPVDNITIEAMTIYLLDKICEKFTNYRKMKITVSSGPGQYASCEKIK